MLTSEKYHEEFDKFTKEEKKIIKKESKDFKKAHEALYAVYNKMKKKPELIAGLTAQQYGMTCEPSAPFLASSVGTKLLNRICQISNDIYEETLEKTNNKEYAAKTANDWEIRALKAERIARLKWEPTYKYRKDYPENYHYYIKHKNGSYESVVLKNWNKVNPDLCQKNNKEEIEL